MENKCVILITCISVAYLAALVYSGSPHSPPKVGTFGQVWSCRHKLSDACHKRCKWQLPGGTEAGALSCFNNYTAQIKKLSMKCFKNDFGLNLTDSSECVKAYLPSADGQLERRKRQAEATTVGDRDKLLDYRSCLFECDVGNVDKLASCSATCKDGTPELRRPCVKSKHLRKAAMKFIDCAVNATDVAATTPAVANTTATTTASRLSTLTTSKA